MPVTLIPVDHQPLFQEFEMKVTDEDGLAGLVADMILGHHRHVQSILEAKNKTAPPSPDDALDRAIAKLVVTPPDTCYKRDGWVFQMMTWVAIRKQFAGQGLISQVPHDAPAQHGIDGLSVLLSAKNALTSVLISEDKYTEHSRATIKDDVWPEFEDFENGVHDNKLVTRITGLLPQLTEDEIDALIGNDIYRTAIRSYRVGITPQAAHFSMPGKKRLFKGYNKKVTGADHLRRNGVTFQQADIRQWMGDFCEKIIEELEERKT